MEAKNHYKVKRSTAVLALSSAALASKPGLDAPLRALRAVNYDYERLDNDVLTSLYAGLDDEFTSAVLGEFTFVGGNGSVRDLGRACGICSLCGKGDSKDDGTNADHLRYEFRLVNGAGGTEVWTGSTCIINHSLKVLGAANADEARRILEHEFREHLSRWKVETWKAANPDHPQIPAQYESFRFLPRDLGWGNGRYVRFDAEAALLGIDLSLLAREANRVMKRFASAARKYQRDGHLGFGKGLEPSQKMEAWTRAQAVLAQVAVLERALLDAQEIKDPDARIEFFAALGEARKPATVSAIEV